MALFPLLEQPHISKAIIYDNITNLNFDSYKPIATQFNSFYEYQKIHFHLQYRNFTQHFRPALENATNASSNPIVSSFPKVQEFM
jgi:beta-galactosidase/beta-glucuronidase